MATIDNSLRPYLDRTSNAANPPSAINPGRSPRGNYLDSAISASLWTLNPGPAPAPATVDFDAGDDSLALVLFGTGAPASLVTTAFVTGIGSDAVPAAVNSTTAAGGLITAAPPTTTSITPDAGPFQAGEVQTYTISAVDNVPGYGYSTDGIAGTAGVAYLVDAITNSGVVSGWATSTGAEVVSGNTIAQSVQSIILAASDYTAAIQAAGNLITIEVANTSVDVYRVVGVWESFAK